MKTLFVTLFTLINMYAQESPSIYTYKFGDSEISLLQELSKNDKPEILIDISPEIVEKYATSGTFSGAVNAFFVRINGQHILIDSGFGTKLFENLQLLDVDAENVHVILMTHLHGDHIGGMMKGGNISFPNAKVYISQREYDYWAGESNEKTLAFLDAYKSQIHLFEPNEFEDDPVEIIFGVSAFAAYGHTPGHTVYQFTDSDEKILVIGDVINVAAVQFPHPEIAAIYDVDKKEASKTKVKVLKYASENNVPVAGMHLSFPGMGSVSENEDGGFDFQPN